MFSNFSILFTVNISTIFSHPKVPRRRGSPLDMPLAPAIRSAIDILMVTINGSGVDCELYAKLWCI